MRLIPRSSSTRGKEEPQFRTMLSVFELTPPSRRSQIKHFGDAYAITYLTDVELCEGLVQFGRRSFAGNDNSITKINIPSTLRRIHNQAFYRSLRTPIRLHDGIDHIGGGAFAACIFTNFRIPPLITIFP